MGLSWIAADPLALNDTRAWRDWTEVYLDYKLGKLTKERASQIYRAHKGKKRSDFTLGLFERFVVDVAKRIPKKGKPSETLLDRAIERTRWETLDRHLERMDRLLDPKRIAEKEKLYKAVWEYEDGSMTPRIVLTSHLYPYPERNEVDLSEWDTPPHTQGMVDEDMMLVTGLVKIYVNMVLGDDSLPILRADYGPGCIPTMFGCRTRFTKLIWKHIGVIDFEPPDVLPLDFAAIKSIIESGVPDLTKGFGGRVLETEGYFVEKLAQYESLRQTVHIGLCDMQGPFDLAYLLLGERIYKDVKDHPDMVAELLDLLTETFIRFAREQKRIIGEGLDRSYQREGYWAKGGVKVTDNAALRLSEDLYERFCKPYNERILREFGGGVIHVEKAAVKRIDSILRTEGLIGLSLRVPEDFDLGRIYGRAAQRQVCLILNSRFEEIQQGKPGMINIHEAVSLKKAKKWLTNRRS